MSDYCDGLGKCLKGFAAATPDAPVSDNRQQARDLLTAPHPGTDINPYWRVDMLAAALDAAEARGRAEIAATVEKLAQDYGVVAASLHDLRVAAVYGDVAGDLIKLAALRGER